MSPGRSRSMTPSSWRTVRRGKELLRRDVGLEGTREVRVRRAGMQGRADDVAARAGPFHRQRLREHVLRRLRAPVGIPAAEAIVADAAHPCGNSREDRTLAMREQALEVLRHEQRTEGVDREALRQRVRSTSASRFSGASCAGRRAARRRRSRQVQAVGIGRDLAAAAGDAPRRRRRAPRSAAGARRPRPEAPPAPVRQVANTRANGGSASSWRTNSRPMPRLAPVISA